MSNIFSHDNSLVIVAKSFELCWKSSRYLFISLPWHLSVRWTGKVSLSFGLTCIKLPRASRYPPLWRRMRFIKRNLSILSEYYQEQVNIHWSDIIAMLLSNNTYNNTIDTLTLPSRHEILYDRFASTIVVQTEDERSVYYTYLLKLCCRPGVGAN